MAVGLLNPVPFYCRSWTHVHSGLFRAQLNDRNLSQSVGSLDKHTCIIMGWPHCLLLVGTSLPFPGSSQGFLLLRFSHESSVYWAPCGQWPHRTTWFSKNDAMWPPLSYTANMCIENYMHMNHGNGLTSSTAGKPEVRVSSMVELGWGPALSLCLSLA